MSKYIYVITVMERFNKEVDYEGDLLGVYCGNKRIVAICDTYNEAIDIVEYNIGDIWETVYDFACIEELELNEIYPCASKHYLFKFNKEDGKYYVINKEDYPKYSICEIG